MAITLDGSAKSGTTWVTGTITFSLTNTAGDYVIVAIRANSDSITGVTYAAVTMTQLGKVNRGGSWFYFYGLAAPATGANNVVVSVSGSENRWAAAESLLGVKQTSPLDTSNSATSASSPNTVSVTSTVAGVWLAGIAQGGGSLGAGTDTTLRQDGTGDTDTVLLDSNAAKGAAGSYSLACTHAASGNNDFYVIALAPPASAVTHKMLTLGAG